MQNKNELSAKDIYITYSDYWSKESRDTLDINQLEQRRDLNPNSIPAEILYSPHDFNIPRPGRALSALKVGNLLIKSEPGGKGSFEAEVSYLDKARKQQRTLFTFKNGRYAGFDFESLFPYPLGDSSMTMVGGPEDTRELMTNELAKKVKPFILQMSFGEEINQADFQSALTNLFTFRQETAAIHRRLPQTEVTNAAHDLDMDDFRKNPNIKPATTHSLAVKIAYTYFNHLGITEDELKALIKEFIEASRQTIADLNPQWIENLMDVLIDKNRYALRMVITQEILQKCIRDYDDTQQNNMTSASASLFSTSSSNKNNLLLNQTAIKAHLNLWNSIDIFRDERSRLAALYKQPFPDEIERIVRAFLLLSEDSIVEWHKQSPLDAYLMFHFLKNKKAEVSDETRRSITPIANSLRNLAIKIFHSSTEDEQLSLRNEFSALLISSREKFNHLEVNPKTSLPDCFPPETIQRFDEISTNFNELLSVISLPVIEPRQTQSNEKTYVEAIQPPPVSVESPKKQHRLNRNDAAQTSSLFLNNTAQSQARSVPITQLKNQNLSQAHPTPHHQNYSGLFDKIEQLESYGTTLLTSGRNTEGNAVHSLSSELRRLVKKMTTELNKTNDENQIRAIKKTASQNISICIKDGRKIMGKDRKWNDIIAHFLFACTGVGLLIMGINKYYSGQFFLNLTERQKRLREVEKEVNDITSSPQTKKS